MLNARQRVMAAIELGVPEVPAAMVLSAGCWAIQNAGYTMQEAFGLEAKALADILQSAYDSVDSDMYWTGSGYNNMIVAALGGSVKWREKSTPDVAEHMFSRTADIERADISRFDYSPERAKLLDIAREMAARAKAADRLLGAICWGPLTLAGLLVGSETLMRDIRKDPAAVEMALDRAADFYIAYMAPFLQAGVDFIEIAEPSASGDMIGYKHYENIVTGPLRKITSAMPQAIFELHICGFVEDRYEAMAESGAKVVSLDYKSSLSKAKDVFGGKMAVAGNLDPVEVVALSEPGVVAAQTAKCMAEGGPDGFLLMPGCDIPPATPVENLRAMIQSAHAYTYGA